MVESEETGTRTAWMDVAAPSYAPLGEDTAADVCIVGAGIAGLTTAYSLAARRPERRRARRRARRRRHDAADDGASLERARRSLPRDRAAARARGRTPRGGEPHGRDRPHRSHRRDERIDCDFERLDGYLVRGAGRRRRDFLDRELDAAQRAGLADVDCSAARRSAPSTPAVPALPAPGPVPPAAIPRRPRARDRAARRAHLQRHARRRGRRRGRRAASRRPTGARCRAAAVVVATNTPINDVVAIHTKQAPYRTYVVAAARAARLRREALYWDTADPYHYVRLRD